jgi:hypothetical protein
MPKPTAIQKAIHRDKATVQAEAQKANNPNLCEADRTRAIAMLSKTVLKGTGLSTTGDSGAMLGRLTADLVAAPGTVIELGVKDTIALKVSPSDAASIPPKIIDRLKKLV